MPQVSSLLAFTHRATHFGVTRFLIPGHFPGPPSQKRLSLILAFDRSPASPGVGAGLRLRRSAEVFGPPAAVLLRGGEDAGEVRFVSLGKPIGTRIKGPVAKGVQGLKRGLGVWLDFLQGEECSWALGKHHVKSIIGLRVSKKCGEFGGIQWPS